MNGRADGYTEEQIVAWCPCRRSPDNGPEANCPLHGESDVEWQPFTCEGDCRYEPIGLENSSEEMLEPKLRNALESAENELADIRREVPEAFLMYRLLGDWTKARD